MSTRNRLARQPRLPWSAPLFVAILAAGLSAACCAAPKAPAGPLSARIGLRSGVCALLGLPQGAGAGAVVSLARGSDLLVYVQSPDAREARAVREAAEAAGLLGTRITVEEGDCGSIHLGGNLAGAILVGPAAEKQVSDAELLRVLHPEGRALRASRVVAKPFPAGADAWSHPFHGPDNNPQSADELARAPYRTQFLAEPMFSPMPEVTVAAGGRIFKAFGHISHKANQNAVLNTLMGINAFNGAILWRRPLREGFMIHRNTLVATPDLLYLADDQSCKVMDARTGEVKREIVLPAGLADGPVWKWMALEGDVLYALVGGQEIQVDTVPSRVVGLGHWPWSMWQGHEYADPRTSFGFGRALVAVDPATGKVLRSFRSEDYLDARGVCMGDGRIYAYSPRRSLACLDGRTLKPLWRTEDPELLAAIGADGRAQNPNEGYATTTFIKCSRDYVFFAGPQRPNLVVVSARDGKLVWQRRNGNLHLILRRDALYAVGPQGAKIEYGTWRELARMPNRRACTRATGGPDAIFYRAAEGTVRWDLASDTAQHIAPMRPPCQDGVVVANGMLYWGPWMCGCPLSLYGHIALAHAANPRRTPDSERLQRGAGASVASLAVERGDWPCFRGDNARTSVTPVSLGREPARAWVFTPATPGMATAPAAAGGLVFVGDQSGVVRALDAATGKERWRAFTGGPVYFPPALWRGRALVGSADGRVYALEAATGKSLWSFQVAPAVERIPVYGRLLSRWPVAGGVVVQETQEGQGIAYAAAGIAHYDGTHVVALDAATGSPRWTNDSSGTLSAAVKSGVSLQGELSIEEGELRFAGGGVYQTARYDLRTGRCLNEPRDVLGSQFATAFYPYYPEYGKYLPLHHTTDDGNTLSYEASYDGVRHLGLALLRPAPTDAPPPQLDRMAWQRLGRRAGRAPVWQDARGRRFCAFAIAPDVLVAAGEAATDTGREFFIAAVDRATGADVWRHSLPAAMVRGGLAVDHTGRVFASLEDGRIVCLAAGR